MTGTLVLVYEARYLTLWARPKGGWGGGGLRSPQVHVKLVVAGTGVQTVDNKGRTQEIHLYRG